jgi:sirohydrochlorin cobaltochelatase
MHGLLLFAHGSRDPEWAAPFNRILTQAKQYYPSSAIALAYLEKMQPDFFEAAEQLLDQGSTHITVLPLFLAKGGHLKADLSTLIRDAEARWPSIQWTVDACIGDDDFMQTALIQWVGMKLSLI